MEVLYACCCGLDVHKKGIIASYCVKETAEGPRTSAISFGTMVEHL